MLDLMALVWFFARDPLSVGGEERAWVRQSAARRRLRISLPALPYVLLF
jgi:hypothetical protein